MKIDVNDPRWTAYALGELEDGAERAEIEAALNESAEARRLVTDIRSTAGMLAEDLRNQPAVGLTAGQRGRILAGVAIAQSRILNRRSRILVGLAAAAALVLVVMAGNQLYRHARNTASQASPAPIATKKPQPQKPAVAAAAAPAPVAAAPSRRPLTAAATPPPVTKAPSRGPLTAAATPPHQVDPRAAGESKPAPKPETPRFASLTGRITDAAGGVIPGAEIQITDEATGAKTRAVSGLDGKYSFPNLNPGAHTLTASMPGFKQATITGLNLNERSAGNLHLKLHVGGISETVTVSATAEPPQAINAASISNLPLRERGTVSVFSYKPGQDITADGIPLKLGGVRPSVSDVVRRAQEYPRPGFNTEAYDYIRDNPFLEVAQNPLSTFSIDVDTASYANVRRFLDSGSLPPKDAVRIEELINYFAYDYAGPRDGRPFAANMEVSAAPWDPAHRLLRIGLKGRELEGSRPPANLVFLLDVSGSMQPPNKLPLVKESMRLLVDRLTEADNVAIVVYAGASGLVLPSTSGYQKEKIREALDRLQAGGSTNGASGIELAYRTAEQSLLRGGINRIILATDGDFNVGVTNRGDLTRLIEEKAKSGIFLSALGFGMGNYKDSTIELLADKGNGNYAYIDSLLEAKKVLVDQIDSTLVTIAKDVKIQIEFNPAEVGAYRLIGYENRLLNKEDFNDDAKDAGEIGAGHTVTVLYELVPPGVDVPGAKVDPLRYQQQAPATSAQRSGELLTLKIRHKEPDQDRSVLAEYVLRDSGMNFSQASRDFKFAAAVAAFGMVLRDSPYKGSATLESALQWAQQGLGSDQYGYRQEFVRLTHRAISIPRR